MKKNPWLKSWPRILLWSHVIGVVWFYLGIWIRTSPAKNSQVKVLPPRSFVLVDVACNLLVVAHKSLRFSANGNWAGAEVSSLTTSLIPLATS